MTFEVALADPIANDVTMQKPETSDRRLLGSQTLDPGKGNPEHGALANQDPPCA